MNLRDKVAGIYLRAGTMARGARRTMTLPHGDDHGPPTLVWGRTAWSWTRLAVIGLVGGAISGLAIPAARFLLPQSAWEPSLGPRGGFADIPGVEPLSSGPNPTPTELGATVRRALALCREFDG